MTNTELAELLLTKVFDEAEANGHETQVDLVDIARDFGINDRQKIFNVAKYLESENLIDCMWTVPHGVFAMLTGNGAIFVERGGNTGIITKYRKEPTSFVVNIDSSTTIHGNVSHSNITTHSADVSQNITLSPEVQSILTQVINTLRKDSTLTKEFLSDAVQDVETLKLQLSKTNKNKLTIESILSSLANISSIGSLISQLWQLI